MHMHIRIIENRLWHSIQWRSTRMMWQCVLCVFTRECSHTIANRVYCRVYGEYISNNLFTVHTADHTNFINRTHTDKPIRVPLDDRCWAFAHFAAQRHAVKSSSELCLWIAYIFKTFSWECSRCEQIAEPHQRHASDSVATIRKDCSVRVWTLQICLCLEMPSFV